MVIAVCEIVFAKVIDHRSRVKMIHHRPIVYTYRLATLSWSKTHQIAIDRRATRLDSLPSPTQFLPRSGPRSMGKVASCNCHCLRLGHLLLMAKTWLNITRDRTKWGIGPCLSAVYGGECWIWGTPLDYKQGSNWSSPHHQNTHCFRKGHTFASWNL